MLQLIAVEPVSMLANHSFGDARGEGPGLIRNLCCLFHSTSGIKLELERLIANGSFELGRFASDQYKKKGGFLLRARPQPPFRNAYLDAPVFMCRATLWRPCHWNKVGHPNALRYRQQP